MTKEERNKLLALTSKLLKDESEMEALKKLAQALNEALKDEAVLEAKKEDEEKKIQNHLEMEITNLMRDLRIPAHLKGYQYLRHAIVMSVKDSSLTSSITKLIYPTVAKVYCTTAQKVERAIRNEVEVMWGRGALKAQKEIFGYNVDEQKLRPTNSECIAAMADYVRMYCLS